MAKHTIAMVFDFDDTLVPDSTTALLIHKGVDAEEFWKVKVKQLIEDGWDPVHAYLKLILDLTRRGQPLYGLTSNDLAEFGSTLKPYPGAQSFFKKIKDIVNNKFSELDIDVKFWVISGGLEDIIAGCKKISKHLTGYWGCRLAGDHLGGNVKYIKRAVSFTEKTRYLFEINKGLNQSETNKNPLLVNIDRPYSARAVPFSNIIYIGDGLTDIPCFSLVKSKGGSVFGILHKDDQGTAKRDVFKNLVRQDRVMSLHSPRYGKNSDLGVMLETAVVTRCSELQLEEKQALVG